MEKNRLKQLQRDGKKRSLWLSIKVTVNTLSKNWDKVSFFRFANGFFFSFFPIQLFFAVFLSLFTRAQCFMPN